MSPDDLVIIFDHQRAISVAFVRNHSIKSYGYYYNLIIKHVQKVIDEIAYNPVEEYFTEVRWCHDIDAPVFNRREINCPYKLTSSVEIVRPSGEGKAIVFSKDLQSEFNFNSTDPQTLLDHLIQHAIEPVAQSKFSRCHKKDGTGFEFREFSDVDFEYIQNTIMAPNL